MLLKSLSTSNSALGIFREFCVLLEILLLQLSYIYDTKPCFYTFGSIGSDLSFGSGSSGLIGFHTRLNFISHEVAMYTFKRMFNLFFLILKLLSQMLLKALLLVRREGSLLKNIKANLSIKIFQTLFNVYQNINEKMEL